MMRPPFSQGRCSMLGALGWGARPLAFAPAPRPPAARCARGVCGMLAPVRPLLPRPWALLRPGLGLAAGCASLRAGALAPSVAVPLAWPVGAALARRSGGHSPPGWGRCGAPGLARGPLLLARSRPLLAAWVAPCGRGPCPGGRGLRPWRLSRAARRAPGPPLPAFRLRAGGPCPRSSRAGG